ARRIHPDPRHGFTGIADQAAAQLETADEPYVPGQSHTRNPLERRGRLAEQAVLGDEFERCRGETRETERPGRVAGVSIVKHVALLAERHVRIDHRRTTLVLDLAAH